VITAAPHLAAEFCHLIQQVTSLDRITVT